MTLYEVLIAFALFTVGLTLASAFVPFVERAFLLLWTLGLWIAAGYVLIPLLH